MTNSPNSAGKPRGKRILILEDADQLGEPVEQFLAEWGNRATRLTRPDDGVLREHLAGSASRRIDAVAIVTRDDIIALRYALLAEHLRPGIRLVVTIFDRTTAGEVARSVPNCTVLAMTDAIVPNLLAACLDPRYSSVLRLDGKLVAVTNDGELLAFRTQHPGRARGSLADRYATLETSARALLLSFSGLMLSLILETVLGMTVLHEHWYDAVWQSARALTTIGSSDAAEHGPAWYKIVSGAIMLGVLAMVGLFTASLVDRVTGRRLTGIVGSRAVPVRDHVIVVGLGQVGLRLCVVLRELGIRVVAIERDAEARCLPLARQLRIPVVLGRAGDRFLLQRLGIDHARAVAAVSSNALDNIAVAVTARAIAPELQIVLRTGGAQDIVDESRSLFHIGSVCDVPRTVGALVACHALGTDATHVCTTPSGQTYAIHEPSTVVCLSGPDA